jgi:glycosyltransferase involved in cell wall biosynthesis
VPSELRTVTESTFLIATNGTGDGPGQALRDYLRERGAREVTVVSHPLSRDDPPVHVVTRYAGDHRRTTCIRLPNRPPWSFPLDLCVPVRLPDVNAWFGFNNLAAFRGLAQRRLGKADKVYYWAVDFVPDRFGRGLTTRSYDSVDRFVSARVDARVELSEAALNARAARLGLPERRLAPAVVVPMGAWLARAPRVPADAWSRKRLVYLGHLVPRQGVSSLVSAMALLVGRHADVRLDVIGKGPQEPELRELTRALGLEQRIEFHGFVADHADVERLLAQASVAVAPYAELDDNFTRFADPGKLKAYLAAGLPIVLTSVPPNARELEAAGAALLSGGSPEALADSLGRLLGDEGVWLSAHRAALNHARRFDWPTVLGEALAALGFQ